MRKIQFILVLFGLFSMNMYAQSSVYIKGTGLNYNGNRVVKLNNQYIVNTGGRGLCLTIINASTHLHTSSTTYDTYGSTAASDNLATALNDLKRGQIGILTSYDAWEGNVSSSLKSAARRLGLYKLGGGIDYGSRISYASIFRGSGTATNNAQPNHIAYEVMQSNASGAERAVIATWLIDDAFIGNNITNALVSANGNDVDAVVLVDDASNVGIGTATPDSKLTVAGKVHAQEVKVTVTAGADFVFEDSYQPPTLKELESFIKTNKHLPEIASAKEMETEGLELGAMNIKLLQKIEELTLYTIEQEKELETQIKQNKAQNFRIESLEKENKRITKLENLVNHLIKISNEK